jgi:hypothetical protein
MKVIWTIFREEWRQCRTALLLFCGFLGVTGLAGWHWGSQSVKDELSWLHGPQFFALIVFLLVFPVRQSGRDLNLGLPEFHFTLPVSAWKLTLLQMAARLLLASAALLWMGGVQYGLYSFTVPGQLRSLYLLYYPLAVLPYIVWAQVFACLLTGLGLRAVLALPLLFFFVFFPVWTVFFEVASTLYDYPGKLLAESPVLMLSPPSTLLGLLTLFLLMPLVRHRAVMPALPLPAPARPDSEHFYFQWRFTAQCWFEWKDTARWYFWIALPCMIGIAVVIVAITRNVHTFMLGTSILFPVMLGFVMGFRLLRCAPAYRHFVMTLPRPRENLAAAKLAAGYGVCAMVILAFSAVFVIGSGAVVKTISISGDDLMVCWIAFLAAVLVFFNGRMLLILYISVILPIIYFFSVIEPDRLLIDTPGYLLMALAGLNLAAFVLRLPARRYLPWLSLACALLLIAVLYMVPPEKRYMVAYITPWLLLGGGILYGEAFQRKALSPRLLLPGLFAVVTAILLFHGIILLAEPAILLKQTELEEALLLMGSNLGAALLPIPWTALMLHRQRVQ